MTRILICTLVICSLALSSCNSSQRTNALSAMRELQSSGVAQAAEPSGQAATLRGGALPGGQPQQDTPPPGPPAGGPGTGGPADPPAGAQPGLDKKTAAPAGEEPRTNEKIIADFVESDPRDILKEKSQDLRDRQTKPWDVEKPETFVPETGRGDPMTALDGTLPTELLPSRSADDDENNLQDYVGTLFATQVLQGVARTLQCHAVIQIGIQKYAQMSFGGEGAGRFVLTEGSNFNQMVPAGPIAVTLGMSVESISSDEVVVRVTATPQGSAASIDKTLVFIPRLTGK